MSGAPGEGTRLGMTGLEELVGTGRFELPTPRTPSECSTRLSHVPTEGIRSHNGLQMGLTQEFYHQVGFSNMLFSKQDSLPFSPKQNFFYSRNYIRRFFPRLGFVTGTSS